MKDGVGARHDAGWMQRVGGRVSRGRFAGGRSRRRNQPRALGTTCLLQPATAAAAGVGAGAGAAVPPCSHPRRPAAHLLRKGELAAAGRQADHGARHDHARRGHAASQLQAWREQRERGAAGSVGGTRRARGRARRVRPTRLRPQGWQQGWRGAAGQPRLAAVRCAGAGPRSPEGAVWFSIGVPFTATMLLMGTLSGCMWKVASCGEGEGGWARGAEVGRWVGGIKAAQPGGRRRPRLLPAAPPQPGSPAPAPPAGPPTPSTRSCDHPPGAAGPRGPRPPRPAPGCRLRTRSRRCPAPP